MAVMLPEDYKYELPEMYRVRQRFDQEEISDPVAALKLQLQREEIRSSVKKGMKTAVAVGSRGIANIQPIVKTLVNELKAMGAEPFVVSAMGSHGGGNEEGQREVLKGYGITGEILGVPVICRTDVTDIGKMSDGRSVYFDSTAFAADAVIPVNRIKLHTDFRGDLQSGLCKMLVIGLGNQKGCSGMHEEDPCFFAERIEEAVRLIMSRVYIPFGVGIMENAYDRTCHIEALPGQHLIEREKELVRKCVSLMPFIRIKKADVIIVDEIGKNISGAGYDPNIIGRSCILKDFVLQVPEFQKMILLDVTDASHGNAIGIGQFDVVTKTAYEKMNREITYANAIACKCPQDAAIPVVAENADEALRMALKCCRNTDRENAAIVEIKNTSELEYIRVSGALRQEVTENEWLSFC